MKLNEHDFLEAFRYKANSEKTYFTRDIILEILKDKEIAEAFENLQFTRVGGQIMSELKPCPFCGALPQSGVEFYESCGAEVRLSAVVKCTGCGVYKRKIFKATDNISFVPFYDYENAFNDVIREWNRRVDDDEF